MKIFTFDKMVNAGIVLLAFAGLAVAAAHTEPSKLGEVLPWTSASEYVSALPEVKDLQARNISNIGVRCEKSSASKLMRVQVDYLQDGTTHTIYTPKTCRYQGLDVIIRPDDDSWVVQTATRHNKAAYGDIVRLVHAFSTPKA